MTTIIAERYDCPLGKCRVSFPCLGCQGDNTLVLADEPAVVVKEIDGCHGREWRELRSWERG